MSTYQSAAEEQAFTGKVDPRWNGGEPSEGGEGPLAIAIDTIEEFAEVEEPGASPLIGDAENVLIPEAGDVMVYGDGGAGKTTLMLDAACHLGAGQDWIGLPIPRALRCS